MVLQCSTQFCARLSDKGYWRVAAACLSAPSDVLVEAVEPLVAEAKDKRLRRIVLSDVITHGNFRRRSGVRSPRG